jgi:hypothetical protein
VQHQNRRSVTTLTPRAFVERITDKSQPTALVLDVRQGDEKALVPFKPDGVPVYVK